MEAGLGREIEVHPAKGRGAKSLPSRRRPQKLVSSGLDFVFFRYWSKIYYIWVRASINVGTRNLISATIYSYHIGPGAFILSIARRKNTFPELACEGSKQKDCTHTEP
ncbi:hypothetical protein VPH35_004800 [Triticum aestivum]|uniref:uncharacterized protein n=1 Tax=Triticum aestivum TaxID=4565 RepID=UPI00084278DC|nr:uncharacterized protein LOC123068100 [Triticum aestivum]